MPINLLRTVFGTPRQARVSNVIGMRRRSCYSVLGVSLLLACSLSLLAGCSGGGSVKLVPLMRSDLPDPEPLIQNVPISEAWYVLEPNGQLVIALRYHAGSLLGRAFDTDWEMSLVLDGLPAGSSRLYKLKGDTVRTVQTLGPDQRRARSWSGIAVLKAPEGGRLHGRFHFTIRQQQFTLLRGWCPPLYQAPMLVCVGEFDAVENAARANEIRKATEAAGFDRPSPPQTAPAKKQPALPAK